MPSNNNHNIYELRSSDVQEVMNKPPGRLVTWGNTVIFLTLLSGFWLTTFIQLPVTYNVPVVISMVNKSPESKNLIELVAKNINSKIHIPIPTSGTLFFDNLASGKSNSIRVILDSISTGNDIKFFINLKNKDSSALIYNNADIQGRLSIEIGTQTIFRKVTDRFF